MGSAYKKFPDFPKIIIPKGATLNKMGLVSESIKQNVSMNRGINTTSERRFMSVWNECLKWQDVNMRSDLSPIVFFVVIYTSVYILVVSLSPFCLFVPPSIWIPCRSKPITTMDSIDSPRSFCDLLRFLVINFRYFFPIFQILLIRMLIFYF